MQTILKDVRYGIRLLLRSPGFAAVALLAITLGIGVNTTIFSAIDATLFHPFSFANEQRLVMVWERNPEAGYQRSSVAPGNFSDWREQNQTLEELVAIAQHSFDLTEGDQPERFFGYETSAGFFDALGVKALYGRTFTPEDGQPGNDLVVVLKHTLWQRRFGADPNIVGQTIPLNRKSFTVIGVMPEGFNFPFNGGELWAPMVFYPQAVSNRGSHFLQAMGLLKTGVTLGQARDDLAAIAARTAEQFPQTNSGITVNVLSITQDATRGSRMYAPVMLGAVGFVLLIACANVANLMLVRGAGRQKEIAIRLAMGASRWRLIRQLLTESLMLSFAGGASGIMLSVWGIRGLAHGIPEEFSKFIPGWHNLVINRTAFLFTLVVSVLSGLLFGLVPAIQSTKTNFNEALKEGGKGSSGKASHNHARSVMVISEVALSLVLLIGSGLMIRSFVLMMGSDFGVDPANVLTVEVSLPNERYETREQRLGFYDQILRRIEALPGVTNVGGTGTLPMSGSHTGSTLERAGQTVFPESRRPNVNRTPVTAGYFEAIGTRLIKGRNFTDRDREGAPPVALVDRAFVRDFFPDREPIGEQFKEMGGAPREIIGVVTDVINEDFDERRDSRFYVPYAQEPWRGMYLIIRASLDPGSLTSAVRGEVSSLDNTLPVFNVKGLQQLIKERMSPKRLATLLMAAFAVIALLLAAIGIYAVMSYAVSQRTHEIGIRMALGARPRDIVNLIMRQGVSLTLVGIGAGLAGAFAMTRAMSGLLYGVSTMDPLTYVGISLLLSAVALLACYVPTRRATKVDPMVALRNE